MKSERLDHVSSTNISDPLNDEHVAIINVTIVAAFPIGFKKFLL
jgi:hypothetical protein